MDNPDLDGACQLWHLKHSCDPATRECKLMGASGDPAQPGKLNAPWEKLRHHLPLEPAWALESALERNTSLFITSEIQPLASHSI
jgi:hypothetical protein